MHTAPLQRSIRVFLDAAVLADAAACVRALAGLGIQADTAPGAEVGADLVVTSTAAAPKSTPWIAAITADDARGFADALERGALTVVSHDAGVEQLTQHVRLAVRDLERACVQDRVAELLVRVEHAAGVGSFEYEPHTGRLWLSGEARRLVGLVDSDERELADAVLARLAAPERRRFSDWLALLGSLTAARELECRLDSTGDAAEWVRFSAPAVEDSRTPRMVRGVVEEWQEAPSHEPSVSEGDGLTFQSDARQFFCALANAIEHSEGHGASVAVFVIDSEDLRSLATSFTRGHQGHLLHSLAVRVRAALREARGPEVSDALGNELVLGRAAGGGLAVVVPGIERRDDVLAIGARLSGWISKPLQVGGRELALSTNLGVIASSLDCRDPEELVRRAETAAYCARREGRDSVKLYAPSMDAEAFERLSLEAALRRALTRDELVLHYQPRVEIRTGRIVGMEALVRWQHPDLGFVSPVRFIPVAEETGLIVPIGAHVMRMACRQAQAWVDAGLPPIRMAVNLSPLQLHDRGLLGTIEECLRLSRLPADSLELELTESALMRDPASDVELLRQIKALGAHLSIDDFGTGYSSLAYLRRFPVDALKIDRSFLRDATSRPDDASIFSAIVLMGRSLKMTVVAEGVETPAQLSLLRVMRADEAQGFLLSPPVPADQAARLLAKGTLGQTAA
ncbi:MAG: EAL domain-containing protein [Planctomycetes bacterium]|nr:EAL domain-containing protein [Planctomycetota bacterium]